MSRPTQDTARFSLDSRTGLSPSLTYLSGYFRFPGHLLVAVLQPRMCRNTSGLGCCAFARHYRRNHFCFLFLRVLRCFSSPRSPPVFQDDTLASIGLPHSDIRGSYGYLHLTPAFRSLSRPSSPPRAQAFTVCPFLLVSFSTPKSP